MKSLHLPFFSLSRIESQLHSTLQFAKTNLTFNPQNDPQLKTLLRTFLTVYLNLGVFGKSPMFGMHNNNTSYTLLLLPIFY